MRDDAYIGIFGLSWQEKVVSHLKTSYPSNAQNWEATFDRVYDAYASIVQAGHAPFAGVNDTAIASQIAAMTEDNISDIIKVLSAVSSVDEEKITFKSTPFLTKIISAPAAAAGSAVSAALKPVVPYLVGIAALAIFGAVLYYKTGQDRLRAIAQQKI
ncbi:MAG: hypothetical protein WBM07_17045 [Chitinivibrionales bacterium]